MGDDPFALDVVTEMLANRVATTGINGTLAGKVDGADREGIGPSGSGSRSGSGCRAHDRRLSQITLLTVTSASSWNLR